MGLHGVEEIGGFVGDVDEAWHGGQLFVAFGEVRRVGDWADGL